MKKRANYKREKLIYGEMFLLFQNMFDKCWLKAHHFFDLPDFLTWKATGDLSRYDICFHLCYSDNVC